MRLNRKRESLRQRMFKSLRNDHAHKKTLTGLAPGQGLYLNNKVAVELLQRAPRHSTRLSPQFSLERSLRREGSQELDLILRKEVIQPQVPLRLPCYDLVPIAEFILDALLPCGLLQRCRIPPTFVA